MTSISLLLNSHKNSKILLDSINAIEKYLTDDFMIIFDQDYAKDFDNLKYKKICGFSNSSDKIAGMKSATPYRNVAMGLYELYKKNENSDWYGYMEYDCLVTSEQLLIDLSRSKDFYFIGSNFRNYEGKVPFFEKIVGSELNDIFYSLGCCFFINSQFMKKLISENFFNKFLELTNYFNNRNVYIENENKKYYIYDLSELLYPTLAVHYGGRLLELSNYNEDEKVWTNNNYKLRFRPNIQSPSSDDCLIHPSKKMNELRNHYKKIRCSM